MIQPIPMTVAFDEADGEGIVFFGNYFRIAHRALEAYLPQIGIPWKMWFDHESWGAPLKHVEAEYMRPLRPGQNFTVAVRIARLGETSVTFEMDFCSDAAVTARIKTTHVFMDRKTGTKTPIPQNIRESLARP